MYNKHPGDEQRLADGHDSYFTPQTPITWSTVHAYKGGFAGFYTKSR